MAEGIETSDTIHVTKHEDGSQTVTTGPQTGNPAVNPAEPTENPEEEVAGEDAESQD